MLVFTHSAQGHRNCNGKGWSGLAMGSKSRATLFFTTKPGVQWLGLRGKREDIPVRPRVDSD